MRRHPEVAAFLFDVDASVLALARELEPRSFVTQPGRDIWLWLTTTGSRWMRRCRGNPSLVIVIAVGVRLQLWASTLGCAPHRDDDNLFTIDDAVRMVLRLWQQHPSHGEFEVAVLVQGPDRRVASDSFEGGVQFLLEEITSSRSPF
jgi:hypothetical protein